MVSDDWRNNRLPELWPSPTPYQPTVDLYEILSNAEIAKLKKEIERLKVELAEARRQDIEDKNPDCHMEDKVAIIKGLAKALGVDMGDVFEGHK